LLQMQRGSGIIGCHGTTGQSGTGHGFGFGQQ